MSQPPYRRSLVWATLRQRCPRCGRGRMFSGTFRMNDPCPECGMIFQREEGYFLGAMYLSYALATGVLLPIYLAVMLLFPALESWQIALIATAIYFPFVPAVFRYSRVLWVAIDHLVSPGASCEAAFEKVRRRELGEKPGDQSGSPMSAQAAQK